ncbi:MAG: NAD-dependent epimerase/dehydratase family protein [Candidatus Sungbacteria bacterium]|nr:NAD-dependent epimerase/dehydratase family protein [Candidatus Sungbacteria bacterium]
MDKGFFANKKALVTGGTGLIGKPLVELLLEAGAQVRVVSLDDPSRADPRAEFLRADLTNFEACLNACRGMDIVFNLVGIKGSPKMTVERPASFMVPTLRFNTNMLEAGRVARVGWFLYTSTIGVYAPAEIFRENDVWRSFPSEHDKFGGWAKRMGELQAEAYAIEYGLRNISIVRPANVYGPYDNFDPENAMVIPALIARAMSGENPFSVWGDGSPIRDFIFARDVAAGMMKVVEQKETRPVNLGSGEERTIRNVVDIIVSNMDKTPNVLWDTSKPTGDRKRLMDVSRAREIGVVPSVSLEEGIKYTMEWYKNNGGGLEERYSVFVR